MIRQVDYAGDFASYADMREAQGRATPAGLQLAAEVAPPRPPVSAVVLGMAIENIEPVYPQQAKMLRIEGKVEVELVIAPDGRVESAKARSGHLLLVPAALDAARKWRYEPTLSNGVPVRAQRSIEFNFTLRLDANRGR
jgi:protein TonB